LAAKSFLGEIIDHCARELHRVLDLRISQLSRFNNAFVKVYIVCSAEIDVGTFPHLKRFHFFA
jgi:hypothetical protein